MNLGNAHGRWPRLVLTIPPDAMDMLRVRAVGNLRDPKREALRLILEGLEREGKESPR